MTRIHAMIGVLQLPDVSTLSPAVLITGVLVLLFLSITMLFVSRYRRCPANRVLVISGRVGTGQSARVINGGGAFIWPVIQEYAFLDLTPLQIDINLTDALSLENIRVKVPSQVTVAVGDTPEFQQNAAARILNLSADATRELAANIIFGQMRQVIASMRIEDINRDRDQFRANIEHALEPELKKIGLKLINVNIKDLNDESGYIEAIGREAGARAVNKAKGDVAEQEKLGAIAVAQAEQEKDIEVSNANREREIGVKSAARDTAVRLADLDRETAVAQQRAEFARDTEIAQADQERRIAVSAANANAITGETEAQASIAAAQAKLQVKQAEAFELGETRKRVASAAVSEAENRAQAKAALAEAERIEAERRAALEAPAKAEKARRIVEAEALAESRRLEAQGEAAAIFARLEAEARGEYEKLSKKAEGLERIVAACGSADEAYRLLMLEKIEYLADKTAEAVSNIRFDKVVMWGGANGNSAGSGVSSFVTDLMSTIPPALHTMMNIGGVKLGDGVVQLVEDEPSVAAPAGDGTKKVVELPE
ncbi:MAG TPA: SPFH domain-containing protein [Longimicrobiales bacterium]|nr:SPFH domain-containing protein [Longimicrobiales bacterium]